MDSREILPGVESLYFVLDTGALNENPVPELDRLLHYQHSDSMSFLRTPVQADNPYLARVPNYEVNYDIDQDCRRFTWGNGRSLATRYSSERTQRIADEEYYESPVPKVEDIKRLDEFYNLCQDDDSAWMYLTENPRILSNRRRVEPKITRAYGDSRLDVVSVREAVDLAGVFKRHNNDFGIYGPPDNGRPTPLGMDLPMWCWSVTRLLVPHCPSTGIAASIFDRVDSLLIGLDGIGWEYYSGTGNDTDIKLRYHFNNCLSILTGIGDALALYTRDKFDLDVEDRHVSIRCTKNKNSVLDSLREKNREAWLFVNENHQFIEILHILRNYVIHNSDVITPGPGSFFKETPDIKSWNTQAVGLRNLPAKKRMRIRKYYNNLPDSELPYDPITEWGFWHAPGQEVEIQEDTFIDTYQFISRAVEEIVWFVDKYFQLLENKNQLKNLSSSGMLSSHLVRRVASEALTPILFDVNVDAIPTDE